MKKADNVLTEDNTVKTLKKVMSNYYKSADEWIDTLGLCKHPEGGWFRETYRSTEYINRKCLPARFKADRSFSTAIYFLLKSSEFSAFHKIKQDEAWHFHCGSSLVIHSIDENDEYQQRLLGLQGSEQPQLIVKAGSLFAAKVKDQDSYTLVSCTVAPGFDFDDFEMPSRKQLLDLYPHYKSIIMKLTKE
jgi:uncharacterized protein